MSAINIETVSLKVGYLEDWDCWVDDRDATDDERNMVRPYIQHRIHESFKWVEKGNTLEFGSSDYSGGVLLQDQPDPADDPDACGTCDLQDLLKTQVPKWEPIDSTKAAKTVTDALKLRYGAGENPYETTPHVTLPYGGCIPCGRDCWMNQMYMALHKDDPNGDSKQVKLRLMVDGVSAKVPLIVFVTWKCSVEPGGADVVNILETP